MDFARIPRPAFAAGPRPPAPGPLVTRAAARRLRQAAAAADLLPDLPAPGEAVHALMTGFYDLGQVIAAVCRARPVGRLRVATLCYSRRNVAELVGLLDAGAVGAVTLLASDFFRGHNKDLDAWARGELAARPGCRVGAARTHCKVVCFDLGPADGLVFEGSANLRTNRNREQLTAIRDRPLHDWHAAWIDQLVTADAEGE
ncbi:MAG: hypothetical protein K2X82_02700 [Gemmataceae bacterium]|nr:hypothetical protein [Gemmataceae bacterium]